MSKRNKDQEYYFDNENYDNYEEDNYSGNYPQAKQSMWRDIIKTSLIIVAVIIGASILSLFVLDRQNVGDTNSPSSYTSNDGKPSNYTPTNSTIPGTNKPDGGKISETKTPNEELKFDLIAGASNNYAKWVAYNEGTEFEKKVLAYYIPSGKYSVENIGEFPGQVNVYSNTKNITEDGWEEPGNGYSKLLNVGEIAVITVGKNQHIEIISPDKFQFIKIGEADGSSQSGSPAPSKSTTIETSETNAPETDAPETDAPETMPLETDAPETTPPETIPPETEAPKPIPSTFSIHFIDVGQADAALVECDGHYMLIDGGNKGDSNLIYSVLKKANISKLDIVVGTHAHEDHIGGIPGAYNYTTADITLCPVSEFDTDAFGDFKKYAESKGGGITIPSVGDTYTLGSANIEIIGVNSTTDTNNSSIVLLIKYGNTSFLFTGDAEREAEQIILDSAIDLSATVLKVGHHGGENSTTYPFLREIMPTYAVISVGENNSYGHPTDNTLSRLRDADVQVFRTDMQGDIFCTSDGEQVTFTVTKNANADTLTNPVKIVETEKAETEKTSSATDTEYILNTNTHKFHYPSCSSVKQMNDENKDYFTGTRDELMDIGYDPCGRCDP